MARRARILVALVLVASLAGCAEDPPESTPPTDPVVATPTSGFVIDDLVVRPPDGSDRAVIEDDAYGVVSYVVRQAEDAPAQTAFVSYLLDGRVLDVENLRLEAGGSKAYEWRVEGVRARTHVVVEVRAGSSVATLNASVATWPRPGEDLELGALSARVNEGIKESGARVMVNLTMHHAGAEPRAKELRVRMLCANAEGKVVPTGAWATPWVPAYGKSSRADVYVDDCAHVRYGLEFVAKDTNGGEHWGRVLLVPRGWLP